MRSQAIFTITENAKFDVWDLKTFDVKFTKQFNNKKTRDLYVWRLSHKVMLVFQQEIVVLESDQYSRTFKERADYQIFMNQITFATLNQNEQILGVATTSAAAPEVTLYSTDGG